MKTFIFEDKTDNEPVIKVGESAQENWDLIDSSADDDIWLHLGSFSSSHVVIVCPTKDRPSQAVIVFAANLCKAHSKTKTFPAGVVKVIYTTISNVKKAEAVGSVTTRKTKMLTI
jgi:predicted ribosome quality control (RQC) complex YloA/Tae2 family protein